MNGVNSIKKRDSNLELFRIITMLLIIAHHYVVNSGLMDLIIENPTNGNSIFLLLFGAWGKTGIDCFVFITGYFMCKSKITLKKFLKLLCEVEFYRVIIYFIFLITGYEIFSIKGLIKAVIPVYYLTQNFTACYLVFFLFIPFLNIVIKSMNEKQHVKLISLSCIIYVFLGTVPSFNISMNYVTWFIVLYFISSYVRIYPKKIFENTKLWGVLTIVLFILSSISVIAMMLIFKKSPFFFVADSNKILAVATAFSSFMFFRNVKIKYNGIINMVGASTFGVFLIHANSDTMRRWLWQDVCNNVSMFDSLYIVLHAIGITLAVFVVCSIIDIMRINFIEKPLFRAADNKIDKISYWFESKEKWLLKKLDINQE